MKTMILGLFGVSLAAALSEMLFMGKEAKGIKGALRLMTSLAVLLVIISPLLHLVRGNYSVSLDALSGDSDAALQEKYQTVFENAVSGGSEALLKEGVSDFLNAEFGIDKEDATIKVSFTDGGDLQAISVTLRGAALLKSPDEIEGALKKKLGCEVRVR